MSWRPRREWYCPTIVIFALPLQAGLLIAETEFALQVESDIAPYKGLLMGLFFMTVGMEISVGLFFARIKTVVAGILGLLVGKVGSPGPTPSLLSPVVLQGPAHGPDFYDGGHEDVRRG